MIDDDEIYSIQQIEIFFVVFVLKKKTNRSGIFGVGETRTPIGGGGGDRVPVGDRGRGREISHYRGSGTGSVVPGPAPPRCYSYVSYTSM
ncbi:unnamed protein product [Camellia sinensis]